MTERTTGEHSYGGDGGALLRAMLADPDDDVLRLAYADWLDEHDAPERADFIRVQCALAILQEGTPEWSMLSSREADLLCRHGAAWQAPLAAQGAQAIDFARGFPVAIRIDAADLLTHGLTLFALSPITKLRIEHAGQLEGGIQTLLEFPFLNRVTDLAFSGGLGDLDADRIAACSHLTNLARLDLTGCSIGADGALALATSRCLPRLRSLSLASNGLDDDVVRALITSPGFSALEKLDLSANRISDIGVEALARARPLASLITLDLHGNPIGNNSALALEASTNLCALQEVELSGTTASRRVLEALAKKCASRQQAGTRR